MPMSNTFDGFAPQSVTKKKTFYDIWLLVVYKSEFDGPIFNEGLLKPTMELIFKDLSNAVETVKQ